jgi:hypothetical protein
MDAKTGSVASDDSRAAHSKQHSYEQVFTTFATPQQPRFVQCKYSTLLVIKGWKLIIVDSDIADPR